MTTNNSNLNNKKLVGALRSAAVRQVLEENRDALGYIMPSNEDLRIALRGAVNGVALVRVNTSVGLRCTRVQLGNLCRTFVLQKHVNPTRFLNPKARAVISDGTWAAYRGFPGENAFMVSFAELKDAEPTVGDVVYIPYNKGYDGSEVGWRKVEILGE